MYRWVEHTSELELELEAETEREVFVDGFAAMRELLGGRSGEAAQRQDVALEAPDRAALLADWLAEIAYLAESEGFIGERLGSLKVTERTLTAAIEGAIGDPPHLVKAATYHRLSFARDGERWRARVVLDV